MGFLIGCGSWTRYYIYILISSLTRFLKEDILGVGVDKQIIIDLRIVSHPVIITLIGFISDSIFGMIVWCVFSYRERKREKMNNIVTLMENEEAKGGIPDKILELRDSSFSSQSSNGDNDNLGKSSDVNKETSLKYYLIHNESIKEDDLISKSSQKFILISSVLIAIKEFGIEALYSSNDIFNYYFMNFISIVIILRCFYNKKIYKHHILSVVLVSVVSASCLISFTLMMIFDDNSNETSGISISFEGRYYIIFVLAFCYLIISICFSTGLIFQKNLMQSQFIPSYKFLFYKGIFGVFACIIALIFTTNFPCEPLNISGSPQKEASYTDTTTPSSYLIKIPFNPIFCKDSYENKYYYDNFYSYFVNNSTRLPNNTTGEIFILLGYSILNFIANISIILVNKFLSPFHVLITESLYSLIHIIYNFIISKFIKIRDIVFTSLFGKPAFISVQFVSVFFELLGYLIYLEIIQCNFCWFNKDISKNIRERANNDAIASIEEVNDDEDSMNDSFEMERRNKKK